MSQENMAKFGWTPILDRVVCFRPSGITQTDAGILVEQKFDEEVEVEVAMVGPGEIDQHGRRMPMNINPGDTVLVNKFQVQNINVFDQQYLVCREKDVRAIVKYAHNTAA
jgi:chaperonin GroES